MRKCCQENHVMLLWHIAVSAACEQLQILDLRGNAENGGL